jgi:2-keto-3-deoxy-L-rhamnonate aldolase RhmA
MRAGERLIGTVLTVSDPALAELTADAFDFVWIDLEHAALTVADAQALAIAASAANAAALVRLPRWDCERLTAILDSGVDGIVVPHVETVEQARGLVSRVRYPPHGARSVAHRRASRWGRYAGSAACRATCVVQVESQTALASVDGIAHVDGVDALVIGSADLALDMGASAGLEDPRLIAAIGAVQRAARGAGIASGLAASGDQRSLARALGGRSNVIVYSADVRLYAEAHDRAAVIARSALATTS